MDGEGEPSLGSRGKAPGLCCGDFGWLLVAGLLALALVAPAGTGFWERHPRSQVSFRAWYSVVSKAAWDTPSDVRMVLNSADFVKDNRVVFNVGGNEFRIVAHVSYRYRRVLIKFVGTHAAYDRVDAGTV